VFSLIILWLLSECCDCMICEIAIHVIMYMKGNMDSDDGRSIHSAAVAAAGVKSICLF